MSDLNFTVSADTSKASRDLQRLSASVGEIQRTTSQASIGFQELARTIATAAAAFGSLSIAAKLSDAVTTLDNKIKLVTQSTREFVQVQQLLVDTSIKTRSTISSTVSVYSAFAKSVDKTKVSLQQLNEATDVVQKAISISGSSVESSNAALIQLSQGLQAGQLRGEELNSVMEQTPRIAQAIADGLNVSLGSLRKIAEEGQLTADVVFGALLSQSEKISKEFDKTAITINSAFNQLGDAISFVLGGVVNVTGAGGLFSKVVVDIANATKDSFSIVETYTTIFVSAFGRALSDARMFFSAFSPVIEALGARIGAITPVIKFMGLSLSSFLSASIFSGVLQGLAFLRTGLESVIKQSDILRGIFGEFEILGLVLPEVGMRIRDAFASKTLEEFQANMRKVADAITNGARPIETIFRDFFLPRSFYEAKFSIESALTFVGLMDQKLIKIGNIRLDVLQNAWYNIKAAISEIIDYDLEGKFSSTRAALRSAVYAIALYVQQIGDLFNNVFGRMISSFGRLLEAISGAPRALTILGKAMGHALETGLQILIGNAFFGALAKTFTTLKSQIMDFKELYVTTMKSIAYVSGSIYIGKLISELIYSFTGKPIKVALAQFVADVKEAVTLVFETLTNSSNIAKAVRFMKNLVVEMYNNFSLDKVLSMVKDFAWTVMHFFFMIYDAVVGHSYWPDTINGVLEWTDHLVKQSKKLFGKFKSIVEDSFSFKVKDNKITDYLSNLKSRARDFAEDFELVNPFKGKEDVIARFLPDELASKIANATISGIEKVMRVVTIGLITLLSAIFIPSIRTALLAIFGVQLASIVSKGVESAFGSIMDTSLFGQLGQSLGTTVGLYFKAALAALPETLQLTFNALEGFGKGFIDELGIIGSIIKGIANIFSGGEGNLVVGLLGGAAGLALLTNGKAIIGSILSALTNTTKLKDKTVFDTFFSSIFGTENRAFILAGTAALLSAFSDQVNILQASLMAIPLLLTAIIGKDVAGKLIIDLAKMAITKITLELTAFMATKVAGASFLEKMFGVDNASKIKAAANTVAEKVKQGIGFVSKISDEERKKKYLAGEMSLRDFLQGSKESTVKSDNLSKLGFVLPENVGSGPRKAADKVAEDVKAAFESKKHDLSIVPYISGTKSGNTEAELNSVKSFGERVTDYFSSLGAKWEALSARRKQFYKIAAGAAIVGLATYADDANAATTSSLDNVKNTFTKFTDFLLNNIDTIGIALAGLGLLFRNLGGFNKTFEKLFDFTGLSGKWAAFKEILMKGIPVLAKWIPRAFGVGAAITAIGAIGVALFGQGDSLEEKFQNAYQWMAKMFNFRQANRGRKGELLSLVEGTASLRGEANSQAANVKSRIEALDLTRLTGGSFKEIKALASEMNKLELQAKQEIKLDGEISLVTSDSLDKLVKQLDRALTRAETRIREKGVTPIYNDIAANLGKNDNTSYSGLFNQNMTKEKLLVNPIFGAANAFGSFLKDSFGKFMSPGIANLSSLGAKVLPPGVTTEGVKQDLAEVSLEMQNSFIDTLSNFSTKLKEFRQNEALSSFIQVDPERLKKTREEMVKALDALTNRYADLKLMADFGRTTKAFSTAKTNLTGVASKAGIDIKAGDANLFYNPGLSKYQNIEEMKNRTRRIQSLLNEANINAEPGVAREVEIGRRVGLKREAEDAANTISNVFMEGRLKYLSEISGIQLSEQEKLSAGVRVPVIFDKMEQLGKLRQELSSIVIGAPGATEAYKNKLLEIQKVGKDIQKILLSLKPPAAATSAAASAQGLSVNAENYSRYSENFRKQIDSTILKAEKIQEAIDANIQLRSRVLTSRQGDPYAEGAVAGIDAENLRLEKQKALLTAINAKAISVADKYLVIRDTLEGFDFAIAEAGLSIPREAYVSANSEDRKILDNAISKATGLMNRARGPEGLAALKGLPAIVDDVTLAVNRIQRTSAQIVTTAIGNATVSAFSKMSQKLKDEILANGVLILDLEAQLGLLKGQEGTEGYIKLKARLDEANIRKGVLTDTRSQFAKLNDALPKLNLGVSIDENQFKLLDKELQTSIATLVTPVNDLLRNNPDWDATDALGQLIDPTANSKVKEAMTTAKQGLDKLLIGLFSQDIGVDPFRWLSASISEKKEVLDIVKEIAKIEADLAEIRKKPLSVERQQKEAELQKSLAERTQAKGDILPATLKDKLATTQINISDLFFNYDETLFNKTYERKKRLQEIDEQLLRTTDLNTNAAKALIAERSTLTKVEEDAASASGRAKSLSSTFQGQISTLMSDVFKGTEGRDRKFLDAFSSTVLDNFTTQLTSNLFQGMTDALGMSFSTLFKPGSSAANPMWIRDADKPLAQLMNPSAGIANLFGAAKNGNAGSFFGQIGGWFSELFSPAGPAGAAVMGLAGYADGGLVNAFGTGATPVIAHAGEIILNEAQQARVAAAMTNQSQQVVNVNITGDISRQTKSEIYRMLPSIAEGVNSHNREKGLR